MQKQLSLIRFFRMALLFFVRHRAILRCQAFVFPGKNFSRFIGECANQAPPGNGQITTQASQPKQSNTQFLFYHSSLCSCNFQSS